ncbi:hypothetical protein GPECTOR_7g979 [Gonium pectorale]|uniref:Helicase ATP-binding domain-containing protein n=1 Tax=Gonium pectorale TaxID=33097 RepID=A0A150GUL2_GONPE|nr:hypothetical protein GPECTOR_7g979 [Gonium pectorale]|eukprot:KXZ53529.1 hypothetical protein GPECTOR_7g979 [Gonium pectorale]
MAAPAAAAAGATAGAASEDADLDVPLTKRLQQRKSQPPSLTSPLQPHQPQQPPPQRQPPQQQQQPLPPTKPPQNPTVAAAPAAAPKKPLVQQTLRPLQPDRPDAPQQPWRQAQDGDGGGAGARGTAAAAAAPGAPPVDSYWNSLFGAGSGSRATAVDAVQDPAPQAVPVLERPPLGAGTAGGRGSPLQRRRPPIHVEDTEMARALLAGEYVELPAAEGEPDGGDAGGWAPGGPVLVPSDGANPGMMLHALHARTWLYPKDLPVRQYQLSLVRSALFHNTLVCLPTGLGKTLIAAVVMLNYYRAARPSARPPDTACSHWKNS